MTDKLGSRRVRLSKDMEYKNISELDPKKIAVNVS